MMPTGYTASIADGSITSLHDFALTCARGMGALITMRDASWDAPIPERFEPSDYHVKELEKARDALHELRAMSPLDWQAAADAEIAKRLAAFEERKQRCEIERARYDAMIDQVTAWSGSPEGIKSFMLEQLRTGRDFDCPESVTWYQSLEPMSGEEWKRDREDELTRATARHAAEQQKEIDRVEGRNAWLAQLRTSLGDIA